MMKKEILYSLKDIDSVANEIIQLMKKFKIFTFSGGLGAGKTTLIKTILKKCGIEEDVVTSPTFTYLNQYKNKKDQNFYHFDLYRIESEKEFVDLGFEQYLDEDGFAFIEWPEVIEEILPGDTCYIKLDYRVDDKRLFMMEPV